MNLLYEWWCKYNFPFKENDMSYGPTKDEVQRDLNYAWQKIVDQQVRIDALRQERDEAQTAHGNMALKMQRIIDDRTRVAETLRQERDAAIKAQETTFVLGGSLPGKATFDRLTGERDALQTQVMALLCQRDLERARADEFRERLVRREEIKPPPPIVVGDPKDEATIRDLSRERDRLLRKLDDIRVRLNDR